MTWLPTTTIGMLIASPNTMSQTLPFAAAATAMMLSRLITTSATRIVPTAASSRLLALTWRGPLASSAMSLTPIKSSSAAPTSLSQGSKRRLITNNVRTMRSTIAPNTPQKMPCRRERGGRLRQAKAITTALSPESRMLTKTIAPMASQNCGVASSAIGTPRRELEHRLQQLAHFGRVARDLDAAGCHDRELFLGCAFAARDDRAGVAHALASWRGDAGDKADDGFAHVHLDPLCGGLLVGAADLADHDDRVGFRIVVEKLEHVDVLETVDRVPADAHRRGLPEPQFGQLGDRLVGQRARARHHADAALAMDVPRHDADLDFLRGDHARAVGTKQAGPLALHAVPGADHVAHRDPLGDAHHQIQIGVDCLVDRRGGERRRYIDYRNGSAGRVFRLADRAVDGNALEVLARLLGVDAGDEAALPLGIVAAHAGVELSGLAGDSLGDHLRIAVNEDCHLNSRVQRRRPSRPPRPCRLP